MEGSDTVTPNIGLCASRFARLRGQFCFGELFGKERERFEMHLLDCEACWLRVQQLDAAISLIKEDHAFRDTELTNAIQASANTVTKWRNRFMGHIWFLVMTAVFYVAPWGSYDLPLGLWGESLGL
jgi:hypothetical protein